MSIDEKIHGIKFEKVNISRAIDITKGVLLEDSTPCLKQGLKALFFRNDVVITLTPDQELGKSGISLEALQNIELRYSNTPSSRYRNDFDFYTAIQQNIGRLKLYVNEYKTADKNQRDDVLAWLNYQAEKYRRDYYRDKLAEDGNAWKLFWSYVLEFLVRNGYHGEWIFVSRALFIIVFFALLYIAFFRQAIDTYVAKEEFFDPKSPGSIRLKKKEPESAIKSTMSDTVLSLSRSIWFSFVVFVNPKFPSKYFKFYKSLLFVVIIEWSIGLFMLVIFAYFIASKFPFIKALFGI